MFLEDMMSFLQMSCVSVLGQGQGMQELFRFLGICSCSLTESMTKSGQYLNLCLEFPACLHLLSEDLSHGAQFQVCCKSCRLVWQLLLDVMLVASVSQATETNAQPCRPNHLLRQTFELFVQLGQVFLLNLFSLAGLLLSTQGSSSVAGWMFGQGDNSC